MLKTQLLKPHALKTLLWFSVGIFSVAAFSIGCGTTDGDATPDGGRSTADITVVTPAVDGSPLSPKDAYVPRADGACLPWCKGRQCGDDGCGGSCGSCSSQATCKQGVCEPLHPLCRDDAGCLAGERCYLETADLGFCVEVCDPVEPLKGCASGQSCGPLGFNLIDDTFFAICGNIGEQKEGDACTRTVDGSDCEAGLVCIDQGCLHPCDDAHPCPDQTQPCFEVADPQAQSPFSWGVCEPKPCVPICSGKICGDDGCRGSCGSCPTGETCLADGQCTCTPSCEGRVCGDNGCGGSCGLCSSDTLCDSAGQCVCRPDCSGKTCGDNGCGGSCGGCPTGETCLPDGQCSCTPTCDGDECGDDGCGGNCGSCEWSEICRWGQCCAPNCSGKQCGDNGCGGSCGSCSTGSDCVAGQCEVDEDFCDPVQNSGCAYPNECILLSNEETRCALLGTGTQGDYCSSYTLCAGGYGCFAGACRKVCDLWSGSGCGWDESCKGVTGWTEHGACE
ncbi:MAG: hypothetical protein JRH20_14010 [Deltaproteobacteria bacterium]|nr:hypothetical protein [Deltaproteobacteria bacterium]